RQDLRSWFTAYAERLSSDDDGSVPADGRACAQQLARPLPIRYRQTEGRSLGGAGWRNRDDSFRHGRVDCFLFESAFIRESFRRGSDWRRLRATTRRVWAA